MSTIISFVSSSSAAKAVDTRTLSIKTACGTVITLNFFDTAAMKAVADEIYSGINCAAAAGWNNAASTSDSVTPRMDRLLIASNTKDDGKDSGSETEYEESEPEPTPRNEEDPESSFESFEGHGLTQEITF